VPPLEHCCDRITSNFRRAGFAQDSLDDLQERGGGGEYAVLLCRHCDSEPIEPLAGSASLG